MFRMYQNSEVDQLQYIEAMTIINPQYCKNHILHVEIEQTNEGPIPHLHVYHDHTRNPKKCSYVRLDKAEYSSHHKVVPLPKKIKQEFIELMSSPWQRELIEDNKGNVRKATGYESAVLTWCDTYEDGDMSKFDIDKDGIPIMPDYNLL